MTARFGSLVTAMVTPFREDHGVDLDRAQELARWLVSNGSDAIVVAGSTGEAPTLTFREKAELFGAVADAVRGQGSMIAGVGTYSTAETLELTEAATAAGADGLLVVTPYYNKPNRAGLRAHFEAAADAAGETPVVLYNIPSRCVINLSPDFLAELAAEIDNVVAVKQANNDEVGPIEGLDVLAGNDNIFLRCLELGGTGGILVASHLAGTEMRAMYEAVLAGETARAHELDVELQPIYEATAVTANPIPVKAALEILGIVDGHLRLPMVPASQHERATIRGALERQGLLVAGGTAGGSN